MQLTPIIKFQSKNPQAGNFYHHLLARNSFSLALKANQFLIYRQFIKWLLIKEMVSIMMMR